MDGKGPDFFYKAPIGFYRIVREDEDGDLYIVMEVPLSDPRILIRLLKALRKENPEDGFTLCTHEGHVRT
jgi:hypothetical protein